MVYSGFSTPKDSPILGVDKFVSNIDKKPYQLLTYSSGLGYNFSDFTLDPKNSYHKSAVPSTWANHGGDDVPLYAIGSLASVLFGGTIDQTFVPHAIAFAMCLFKYKNRCYQPMVQLYQEQSTTLRGIRLLKQELYNKQKQVQEPEVEVETTTFYNETINDYESTEGSDSVEVFNATFSDLDVNDTDSNVTDSAEIVEILDLTFNTTDTENDVDGRASNLNLEFVTISVVLLINWTFL